MIQIAAIFRHRVEHSKNIYSYFSFLIRCSEVDTALLSRPCPNSNSKRRLLRNNLLIQRLSNEINRSWHFTTAIRLLENRIALDLLSGVQIAVVSYVFAVADWLLTKATSDGRSVLLSTKRKIRSVSYQSSELNCFMFVVFKEALLLLFPSVDSLSEI